MTVKTAKEFHYATPRLINLPAHIKDTPLLSAAVFHFLGSPQAIEDQIQSLSSLRSDHLIPLRPIVIWEPFPLFCTPQNLELTYCASRLVDILSPNHLELAAPFGEKEKSSMEPSRLEALATNSVDKGIDPDGRGAILVRAGAQGCLVISKAYTARWFLPFYSASSEASPDKIVDSTGAANAFLGSCGVGLLETGSILDAACYGAVGASFAL